MRSAEGAEANVWRGWAARASAALAGGHSTSLKALREIAAGGADWPDSASVYIIRNFTVEPLPEYLRLAGFRRGIATQVSLSGYAGSDLELRDPASDLRSGAWDVVVVALWLDELRQAFRSDGSLDPDAAGRYLAEVVEQALRHTAATVVVTTVLPTVASLDDDGVTCVETINAQLRELARGNSRVVVSDLAARCAELGHDSTVDRRFLLSARAPLRPAAHQAWGADLAQIVASVRGRAKKLLVLDCDNTLWSGILGEDGPGGLAMNSNDLPGRAFHLFQTQLLALHRRGVLLALCSRNNEADVLGVLDHHPDLLIRRKHLAGWEINWGDKAENIQRLAQRLRLGSDSVVFVDDSPAECERVQRALPDLDVLALTGSPTQRLRVLAAYDGWSRLAPTAADRDRTASYVADRSRQDALAVAESKEEFLHSLGLRAEVTVVSALEPGLVERVAQLSQRTNQYNATGRRYTVGEIEQCCANPDAAVLALQVSDRFGDYGVTGAAVLGLHQERVVIAALFVSCRVLGRGVEAAMLAECVRFGAARWSTSEVLVEYRPTPKNGQVQEQLRALDLPAEPADGGAMLFRMTVGAAQAARPNHVTVGGPLLHEGVL